MGRRSEPGHDEGEPRTPLRVRVGRRMRAQRDRRGLTQGELAERAGISRSYYAGLERGRRNMTLDVLERLADVLDLSPEALVAAEEPVERVAHPEAARFADLLRQLDDPARDAVLQVMERFAVYGRER